MARVTSGASSEPNAARSKKFNTDGAVSATSAHPRRPAEAQRSHSEILGKAASAASPASRTSAATVIAAAGTSKTTRSIARARSKKLPEKLENRTKPNSSEASHAAPSGSREQAQPA